MLCGGFVVLLFTACTAVAEKQASSLYPSVVRQHVQANIEKSKWAQQRRDAAIAAAQPWLEMSDDELWSLMYGPGITRSWMVWSNGHCPACKEDVPMYNWKIDAMNQPWKVRCPHCQELFPKNDFQSFYRSGLNEKGIFEPQLADRSLLVNEEHTDQADPLREFGVDDGEGYVEEENRWRFIGAYLIFGQWKQAVHGGIRQLAAAYVLTGDPAYAHKAGVLLDRVADVWPDFDFQSQAVIYEQRLGANGYISVWHDSCPEVRDMVLAYDMVFEALREDSTLVEFLSAKASQHGLDNPKNSFADIQRNIEERIFRDAITNKHKILSNYPQQDMTLAAILAVLGLEENQAAFDALVDAMLAKATAVDGLTGEKGLAGYASYAAIGLSEFLGEFARADPAFLQEKIAQFPKLSKTYRFHIDTHCLGRYYPQSGDSGVFAHPMAPYMGMALAAHGPGSDAWTALRPSPYTLLWRLYKISGDAAYVQTMVKANGGRTDDLPYDLFIEDSDAVQREIQQVIQQNGAEPKLESVNFQEWRIAILRSGKDADARALWLDYDSGGAHSHLDAMNLGLFAYGLDLMPDFGYPPVQFGGWSSPRAVWYTMSAAHNTVVVDGQNQPWANGTTALWADGEKFHAIRASGAPINQGRRFERTAVLVDVAPDSFYVVDVMRVAGGSEQTKFMHSHFGAVETTGLALQPGPEYGHGTQMRNPQWDTSPAPGWHVDWKIEDRYDLIPDDRQVRLRYTDLTQGAEAGLAEGWVVAGNFDTNKETWIPRVLTRRRKPESGELLSTFVAVIDPYETAPTATAIERLPVKAADGRELPDSYVALSITLPDGDRDILIITDPADQKEGETPIEVVVDATPEIRTDADTALVRFTSDATVSYAAVARGTHLTCGDVEISIPGDNPFVERNLQP